MEIAIFISGLVVGFGGGYTVKVLISNRSQKTSGTQSPNVMGEGNSVKY